MKKKYFRIFLGCTLISEDRARYVIILCLCPKRIREVNSLDCRSNFLAKRGRNLLFLYLLQTQYWFACSISIKIKCFLKNYNYIYNENANKRMKRFYYFLLSFCTILAIRNLILKFKILIIVIRGYIWFIYERPRMITNDIFIRSWVGHKLSLA